MRCLMRDGDAVTGRPTVAGLPRGKWGGFSTQSRPSAVWRGPGRSGGGVATLSPSAAPTATIARPVARSAGIGQPGKLALIVISDLLHDQGGLPLEHQQLVGGRHPHDFVGVHEVSGTDVGAG